MERMLTKLAMAKARRAAPRGKFPPAPAEGTTPARSPTEVVDGVVVPAAPPPAAVNISVALMPPVPSVVGGGSLWLAGWLRVSVFLLLWLVSRILFFFRVGWGLCFGSLGKVKCFFLLRCLV
jgi:hypothetical protein